ncbi:MAG: hypothetical protein H5T64_07875 [Chloroflexi bacterium]|nr:hypothetical protein [Chloroflexota bacterium]
MGDLIRAFGLRDCLLIWHLERQGTALDLRSALLGRRSPLHAAISALLTHSVNSIYTGVLDEVEGGQHFSGVVQVALRRDLPEWDIVFLAPSLQYSAEAEKIWYRLLLHVARAAGERGVQRVYAKLVEDGRAEAIFRKAGYVVYATESVFWHPGPICAEATEPLLQPRRAADEWGMQQLYRRTTPHIVQQAEEFASRDGGFSLTGLPWHTRDRHYVYEQNGEIVSMLSLASTGTGHWFRLTVSPEVAHLTDRLVGDALAVIAGLGSRPVYCAVRTYDSGIQGPLQERGFRFLADQILMVKHAVVPVREPARVLAPGLDQRTGVVPTATVLHTHEQQRAGVPR